VAIVAQSDQIAFNIFTRMAPKTLVMNLEVLSRSAELTPPAVASHNALAQIFVFAISEPDWHTFVKR
jgi:hypothetical protein